MIVRVSMLLKSRASPDMLPFSLCNKKSSPYEQTPLSNDAINSVLRHRELGRAKDLSAHPPTVLGMFKDSTIILDTIRQSFLNRNSNSSNFYICSSRYWTVTSLVIFYHLRVPSVSKSRISLLTFDRFRASFP